MITHKSAERLFIARFNHAGPLQRARMSERHYRGYSVEAVQRRIIGWDISRMARAPLATMRDRWRFRRALQRLTHG
jgi:hypothetical protein